MRTRWILVLASSLALAGCAEMKSPAHVEEEGDEVKVDFADAPAPVRETLARETNNAKIATVDRETKDGKTIYEADAMVNGQNWEIKVADDGTLVTKKVDNEEGEQKKGDKEDDEKNERKEKADKD